MLTESATGTFISDHRKFPFVQPHGPPLDRAALIATAADQMSGPSETFLTIEFGKAHPYFLDGNVVQSIRGTDGRTTHAEMTGGFLGVYLRCAGNKKIKTPPHLDTIKNADLRALTALQATGEKFLLTPGSRRPEKFFSKIH